jgi:Kdo2-lipid IVA lauroyltransferase/acyltransferase
LKLWLTRLVISAAKARDWLTAQAIFALLGLLQLLPAKKAIGFVDAAARRIGPLTPRHRLAMANLRRAYPQMSEAGRRAIAVEMWGNMARLAAEYVFLDDIFDLDPNAATPGNIEVSGTEIFYDLRDNPRPIIFFTAHTGNFELLPIAAAAYGLNLTALFRPPNNRYVAERVLKARRTRMGHLVPSRAGAALTLARTLDDGGAVGILVDQKFHKGVTTEFFGLPVKTNPLLAKLKRQYDCEVFPARCVRLPGGRFRLEIEPAVAIPRDADGKVDVAATAQLLNDKVESWVREYPGQWQWFHDRWAIKKELR